MGAGRFTLNISRVNGSVAIDIGIVHGLESNVIRSRNPIRSGWELHTEIRSCSLLYCIVSIGPEIAELTQLKSIDFSNNGFTGSIPSELGNCSLIEYLELSQNKFTGDIPENFGNLLNLRFINLYSNFMKGSIPESLFRIPHLDTV
ncbi:Receptor-like protein kinase [Camellia lanceoleosa]|uniref:Receptor-like protein kinase n=1 Tax=Camellia lanceoleosa TaxID=1840588 RepID=A0ACC0G9Z3_9ERIC|nr:Receptor-like protein kinase [Camellia lanceoleosa]